MIESLPNISPSAFAERTGMSTDAINKIADHLMAAKKPLVVAGGVSTTQAQGLEVSLLTGLLQWATGMIGSTVDFTYPLDYDNVGTPADMKNLGSRLQRGDIGVVFLADVDVSLLPASFGVGANLGNAAFRVGLGEFMTETLEACEIVLPLNDPLESWGDAVPTKGTLSVIQPVIEPQFDTRSAGDIMLELTARWRGDTAVPTYQEYLFGRWTAEYGSDKVEALLAQGFLKESRSEPELRIDRSTVTDHLRSAGFNDDGVKPVLVVAPSLRMYDGSSRDIALMNEIPDPLTTVSWGGWVSVSQGMAEEMGLADGDELAIETTAWQGELPVKVQPRLARGVMVVQTGSVTPTPMTVDERCGEAVMSFHGVTVRPTGRKIALPILAGSKSQEGRGVIPHPPDDHGQHGKQGDHNGHPTMYPDNKYPEYRWGMAIDLDLCTGCSACASACYVENNVPVTGPELHLQGREMSWLRIEPFYEENEVEFQPVMCQQCTNAPCETVCPVFATYHNPEGINAQVYNRCVGTRYCLNNCPYKVRRFNWFDFGRATDLNTTRNPEVSVRGKGIMEKCTFCVQRVRSARDTAKDEERKIRDGEVTPACAQTSPTNAITFGNLLDESSKVSKLAHSDRAHKMLDAHLGTEPGVVYLRNTWKEDHA
jgi:molybdopterin-containing oxidoreductase family iron-sulfur binding subunit